MLNRRIVAGLAALSAVATVNLLAACTPADDSDVFATPTPGPEPTPPQTFNCQTVWTQQLPDGTVEAFVIDAPEDYWTVGGVQSFLAFGSTQGGFTGVYLYDAHIADAVVDISTIDDTTAWAGTDGTFTLATTVNGTQDGADVMVTALSTTLLEIGTSGEPTGANAGTVDSGDLTGTWTPRGATSPSLTTDTITVTIGATYDVGEYGSWAVCYAN